MTTATPDISRPTIRQALPPSERHDLHHTADAHIRRCLAKDFLARRTPTTTVRARALEALAAGASLDDLCPPDPADPVSVLCAAVDAGDDLAILLLADALEEQGDPRAAGLRRVGDRRPRMWEENAWQWSLAISDTAPLPGELPGPLFRCLEAEGSWSDIYPTRSAALLALAEALAEKPE